MCRFWLFSLLIPFRVRVALFLFGGQISLLLTNRARIFILLREMGVIHFQSALRRSLVSWEIGWFS